MRSTYIWTVGLGAAPVLVVALRRARVRCQLAVRKEALADGWSGAAAAAKARAECGATWGGL